MNGLPSVASNPATLRATLEETCGNITHAAVRLGITVQYMGRLVRRHGLGEYARELRETIGCSATGRPLGS